MAILSFTMRALTLLGRHAPIINPDVLAPSSRQGQIPLDRRWYLAQQLLLGPFAVLGRLDSQFQFEAQQQLVEELVILLLTFLARVKYKARYHLVLGVGEIDPVWPREDQYQIGNLLIECPMWAKDLIRIL